MIFLSPEYIWRVIFNWLFISKVYISNSRMDPPNKCWSTLNQERNQRILTERELQSNLIETARINDDWAKIGQIQGSAFIFPEVNLKWVYVKKVHPHLMKSICSLITNMSWNYPRLINTIPSILKKSNQESKKPCWIPKIRLQQLFHLINILILENPS